MEPSAIDLEIEPIFPIIARSRVYIEAIDKLYRGHIRLDPDIRLLATLFRRQVDIDGIEINEQRMGTHVIGSAGLIIEITGIMGVRREVAGIQYDVTSDNFDARSTDPFEKKPKLFDGKSRVSVTLYI